MILIRLLLLFATINFIFTCCSLTWAQTFQVDLLIILGPTVAGIGDFTTKDYCTRYNKAKYLRLLVENQLQPNHHFFFLVSLIKKNWDELRKEETSLSQNRPRSTETSNFVSERLKLWLATSRQLNQWSIEELKELLDFQNLGPTRPVTKWNKIISRVWIQILCMKWQKDFWVSYCTLFHDAWIHHVAKARVAIEFFLVTRIK